MTIKNIVEEAMNTLCMSPDTAMEALSTPISDYLAEGYTYQDAMLVIERAEVSLARERAHQVSFGIKTSKLDFKPQRK